MLTAHERLTAPGVVSYPPRWRARARNARMRSGSGHEPCKEHLQAQFRPPLPPKPAFAQPDSFTAPIQHPTKDLCRQLKSHR